MPEPARAVSVVHRLTDVIPTSLASEIAKFLVDGASGNVVLNIKDGRLLSYRLERFVSLTAR